MCFLPCHGAMFDKSSGDVPNSKSEKAFSYNNETESMLLER